MQRLEETVTGGMRNVPSGGGRPSNFSPEQDAIILSVSGSEEVNRRFAAIGEPPADPEAIIRRRSYLKTHGLAPPQPSRGELMRAPSKLFERVEALEKEKEHLLRRVEQVGTELDEAREQLTEVLREKGIVPD